MSLYLDASAILPTLIEEATSAAIDGFLLAASEALVVSDFSAAEVASALSRLVRTKFLDGGQAVALMDEFDIWRSTSAAGVDFQPSDFRLAEIFVRRFDLGLRAPDALHVALCRRGDLTLVTLDRRLAAGAQALGVGIHCLT